MLTDGMLLRIYIAESVRIKEKSAYKYLVDYFMAKGFPGCTVFRGMVGYGHEYKIRTVDVLQLSLDLPVVIDVVDTEEKIMAIVPEVEAMVEHGLVTVQKVQMGRKETNQVPRATGQCVPENIPDWEDNRAYNSGTASFLPGQTPQFTRKWDRLKKRIKKIPAS